MRHFRWLAVLAAVALTAGACGGGADVADDPSATDADGSTTSGPDTKCDEEPLEATDVGVTADQITITVMADTGSTIRPGLFQGAVDGVTKWAEYINENGGLACREVVVRGHELSFE